MNIPNFIDTKFTDGNGHLTETWKQVMSDLFTQLKGGLSQEGIKVPSQNQENISKLQNDQSLHKLVVDETNNKLKFYINGEFKTIKFE